MGIILVVLVGFFLCWFVEGQFGVLASESADFI